MSEKGEAFLGKYQSELGKKYLKFLEGEDTQENELYWLQITEKGYLADFLPNVLDLLVCSSRLVNALQDLGLSNLQFIPVVIRNGDEEISGYYICNIVGKVEGLDVNRTQFNVLDAGGGPVTKLVRWPVLKENFESPYEIFRLGESPEWVFASKRVVDCLKKSGLTGLYFTKAE